MVLLRLGIKFCAKGKPIKTKAMKAAIHKAMRRLKLAAPRKGSWVRNFKF